MNPFQKLRYRDDSNERAKYDSLSDDEKTLLEQAGENRTPADLRKRSKPSLPMCFALALLLVSVSLNAVTWSRIRQDHHTTGPSVPAVALYGTRKLISLTPMDSMLTALHQRFSRSQGSGCTHFPPATHQWILRRFDDLPSAT